MFPDCKKKQSGIAGCFMVFVLFMVWFNPKEANGNYMYHLL
jgi:hypothetical protein